MTKTTITAFLLASSAFLSLPAFADAGAKAADDTMPGISTSTLSNPSAPKTRAQVKAELAQAQQDGSLDPVTHSTYPSLLPYVRGQQASQNPG